jgi:anthranilate phosphoribosyltransferase
MTIKEAIKEVIELKDLKQQNTYEVALEIMNGVSTDAQIGALLTALRIKGETVDEITGFVRAMREKVTPIRCDSQYLIDTCGTGGDRAGTFNISTISAFIAAGAGCRVAKHGNRSVSSKCGSADLLEKMGVKIEVAPEIMVRCIDKAGIGFLFAPLLHKAMKYAIGPRREIGVRTIFNILGPLTNPAGAQRQLLGVFNKDLTHLIADVLKILGSVHCLVVHGEDGLDEITITGRTFVSELHNDEIKDYTIMPEDFGIKRASLDNITVNNVEENTAIAFEILKKTPGVKRDIALLNAGAAIYVAGKVPTLKQGIDQAKESIDSGRALEKFQRLSELTQ